MYVELTQSYLTSCPADLPRIKIQVLYDAVYIPSRLTGLKLQRRTLLLRQKQFITVLQKLKMGTSCVTRVAYRSKIIKNKKSGNAMLKSTTNSSDDMNSKLEKNQAPSKSCITDRIIRKMADVIMNNRGNNWEHSGIWDNAEVDWDLEF